MATTEPLERAAPALADPLDRAADARDAERVEAVIGGGEPIAGRLDALRILDGMLDMLEPRAVAGEVARHGRGARADRARPLRRGAAAARQAVRGPGVGGEPALPPLGAVVSRLGRDGRPALDHAAAQGRLEARGPGALLRRPADQHDRPDQPPARQPRRAQAGVRHGRAQPPAGRAQPVPRRARERRHAVAGRRERLRARRDPGRHAGRGDPPGGDVRAARVRARHARGRVAAAADDPAAGQQVLLPRPRAGA